MDIYKLLTSRVNARRIHRLPSKRHSVIGRHATIHGISHGHVPIGMVMVVVVVMGMVVMVVVMMVIILVPEFLPCHS